ncbi:MAG: hypothetical protein P3B98_05715 [Gemmatimonadota bacterium]|nr:hypothetical protein [Gemmatimonadota bacterium]
MIGVAPIALWLSLQAPSPRPVVTVDVQPATVAVGEPFTVRVRVRARAGATIRFPAVPDSAGSVEAVDPRAIEDHSTSAAFEQVATYRFIAWEPGRRIVPLGDVRWEQSRGAELLATGPARVEVTSMLPADTSSQIPRGARDLINPPPLWWRWALGALAVLAILWMARRAWTRRAYTVRPIDPFAEAQRAFAAVDDLALVDAGEPGRAVLAYAEVMREYLTKRFPLATDGLTTAEYVEALSKQALPIMPEEVAHVLRAADAVKFANAGVDAEGVRNAARAARAVVADVQAAYEARLAAADKGKGARARRRST